MTDVWAAAERPRGRRLAFDFVLTALFVMMSLLAGAATGYQSVLTAVLIGIALLIRYRLLRTAIVLAVLSGLLQLSLPHGFAPVADLGYAPLCFLLGAHRSRLIRRVGLCLVTFAIVSSGIWAGTFPGRVNGTPETGFSYQAALVVAVFAAVVTLGGWVAGFLQFQTRSAVQSRVDAQLEEAERRRLAYVLEQEQERNRIAADMHDVVAHAWAVVAAQADGARYLIRSDPDRAEQALVVIGDTARSTIGDLRTILQQLKYRESTGTTPGFEQQSTLFERMRASGMNLENVTEGEPSPDALLALTSYRLLGESLTNALKHGDLDHPVTVVQDWRDGYHLTVRNRLRPGAAGTGTGNGIAGMTERASVAGGRLVSRGTGDEWVVDAYFPAAQEDSP